MSDARESVVSGRGVSGDNRVVVGRRPRSRPSEVRRLTGFLAIAGSLGLYLQLDLYTPFFFPYILFIPCGALLFFIIPIKVVDIWVIVSFVTFAFIGIMWLPFSSQHAIYFEEQLRSTLMLLFSLISSYGFAKYFASFQIHSLSRIMIWLVLILTVGTLLEVGGVIKPLSDAVRAIIHKSSLVYTNDLRDIFDYGSIRPKFFTAEPSHLGKFLGVAITLCAFTLRKNKFLIVLLVCSLGLFGVINSPTIVVGVVMTSLVFVQNYGIKRFFANPLLVFLTALSGIFFLYFLSSEVSRRTGAQMDGSTFVRLFRTYLVFEQAPTVRQILGFGIGADHQVSELYRTVNGMASAPKYIRENFSTAHMTYGNVHSAVLIQFGVLGTIIWFSLLAFLEKAVVGVRTLEFWIFYFFYGMFMASVNTPLLWAPIMLVGVFIRLRRKRFT
ncbi:MAG: hypothetical protein COC24_018075 [Alphaproteobacteria bacterium]|nr:hypothetical protein [Alphaproteobacteria bacterium]